MIGKVWIRMFLPTLFVTIVVTLILATIIGISLGIGWALSLFLPFSLFQGTLLGMVAALATGVLSFSIFRSMSSFDFEEDNETTEQGIPESRFWRESTDRTWEKWIWSVLANSIYEDLIVFPGKVGDNEEEELQYISISLAEAAVGVLKRKSPHARRLRVSRGMLKREIANVGQPSYNDNLLDTAVAAVNSELVFLDEKLREVVRGQLWEELVEVF